MPDTLPPIPASDFDKDRSSYDRRLNKLFDSTIDNFDRRLSKADQHYSAIRDEINNIPNIIKSQGLIEDEARTHFGTLKTQYTKKFERMMRRYLGVDVVPMMKEGPIDRFMEKAISDNVDLIKTIPGDWKEELNKDLWEIQRTEPFNQQKILRVLRDKYKYVGSRLDLITEDQTGKAIGKFTEIRQTQAGIDRYQWQSSEDEVVRPRHEELNGDDIHMGFWW